MQRREGIGYNPEIEKNGGAAETSPLPPFEAMREKEGLEIREHRYGTGWVREYIDARKGIEEGLSYRVFLEYITPQGERFVLNTLLPEGYHLFREEGMTGARAGRERKFVLYGDKDYELNIDEEGKLLQVAEPYFQVRGALLNILHEIGHTQQPLTKEKFWARERLGPSRAFGRPLSSKEREEFIQVFIAEERDAWAYALRRLRDLRRAGVDLEPELDSNEKLLLRIHSLLFTYEREAAGEDAEEQARDFRRRRQLYLHKLREMGGKVNDGELLQLALDAVRPRRRAAKPNEEKTEKPENLAE